MAKNKGGSPKELTDEAVVERVQSILINAAEGRRSVGDDARYNSLRTELIRRPFITPPLVSIHSTVDSFSAYIRGIDDRRKRVQRIRAEFEPIFRSLEGAIDPRVDAEAWTGPKRPIERVHAVRTLLPLAQAAVDGMIATLSEPGGNNGPILDEREEAIGHLRELHRTLGELIRAVDAGHLDDEIGQGLAAEVARYAKRAARALRDDPMPYVSSALLLGVFTACGLPSIGGYLGDVAFNVRRIAPRDREGTDE